MAEARHVSLETLMTQGRSPTHPVAFRNGETLDFRAFETRASAWRAAFEAQPGQRWALYFEDTFELAAALFGGWHAGKCVYFPGDAQPATLEGLREVVDGFAGDLPPGYRPLAPSAKQVAPKGWSPLSAESPALVIYTSGSTGKPAAVSKHLRQLSTEVATLASLWDDVLRDSHVLGTVSHQHIYGLLFRVLWPLSSGRVFHTTRLPYPEDIIAALGKGPGTLVASPAHLKRLPEHLEWQHVRPTLRAVFSSGGPLPAEALPACRALLGSAPLEIYGSSETGGVAWRQRSVHDDAAWTPLPGVELRVDAQTLLVRSPHLNSQEWFRSEDRVRLLPDGFELLGRGDRIEKLEEKRVSLTAMEHALLRSGLVEEARVVPLAGTRRTLGVAAVPTPAGWTLHDGRGKRSLNLALRQALAAQFEPSVLPRSFRYLEAMPANSQGKSTDATLATLFDSRRPDMRILDRSADAARVQVHAAASSPFFDGHFPGRPIFPGVAQVDWAIRMGRALFALPPRFLRLEALKFQQVISPETPLTFDLTWAAERGSLSFKIVSDAGAHASGRIIFGSQPG